MLSNLFLIQLSVAQDTNFLYFVVNVLVIIAFPRRKISVESVTGDYYS